MSTKPIKAIIWDLDGTLIHFKINSVKARRKAIRVLRDYQIPKENLSIEKPILENVKNSKVIFNELGFSAEKINILVHSQGYSFNDAEKNVIGMNHEELGAMVGQKWSFSKKLIYIIRHHHLADESARQDRETSLVYLADIVCMLMGISTGTDGLSYRFYGDVLKRINLSEKDLQGIIAETSENQQKIEHLLKLF